MHKNKWHNTASKTRWWSGLVHGDMLTKLSYLMMGLGVFLRHQVIRGLLYLSCEVAFLFYMIHSGWKNLVGLRTLGTVTQGKVWDEARQIYVYSKGDNSMLMLLFGIATIVLVVLFALLYIASVRNSYHNELLGKAGKRPLSFKDDWRNLFDKNFYLTILTPPMLGVLAFTVLPLIFMILIAFTNFDKNHQPPGNLFTWVGFSNFSDVLWSDPVKSRTFMSLLGWTFIWAIFATFLNYIFGMLLALIINKKGIRLKKFWRTIFVITIAVPQFVSLMLMSQLLHNDGILNVLLLKSRLIQQYIPFLTDPTVAKITVIVVNLWVGVPYSMLITSGILMNIPADLYESAKIDGAGPVTQFFRITLPYMLFVTGPYLITQFIGNINNFNVIYLLTGGGPLSLNFYQAGSTDLLVTWLYKLTVNTQDYSLASVIGIFIFLISAFISLAVFNKVSNNENEENFQ